MPRAIHVVAASGLTLSRVLKLLPGLQELEKSLRSFWPDLKKGQIAITEHNGFILACGGIFELVGEGVACEASRGSTAIYAGEDYENDRFCASRFRKGKPAGRVESSSGEILEDSMGMFPPDDDDDNKRYGQVNAFEVLAEFMGLEQLPELDWTIHTAL